MSALKNFYKHLKEMRGDDRNFVTRISQAAGISRALLNGYLNDVGEPGIETAEKVAAALGTSLASLVGKEQPDLAPPRDPTPEEIVLHILGALNPPKVSRKKLDAIRLILGAKESSLHRALIALRAEVPAREDSESSLG